MSDARRRTLALTVAIGALAAGGLALTAAVDADPDDATTARSGGATIPTTVAGGAPASTAAPDDPVEPLVTAAAGEAGDDDAEGEAAAAAEDAPPPRDPWLRPFASESIWNTPIGSDAVYVPADLPAPARHLLEETTLMRMDPADPQRWVIRLGSWTDRCSGTEDSGMRIHLPDGWTPPDVTSTATPNNPGVFLQPDGRTLVNLNAMERCNPNGPLFAQYSDDADKLFTDLYGDGRLGAHGASNLNQMGGALRPGELDGDEPIQHALDLLIWAEYLYWGGTKESSYRWPADNSDSYAGPRRYRGDNPELRMGSLLALPPELTPDDLGISSDVGRRLFQALQDYGAYVTDDSAWDATYLGVDAEALGTFPWGDDERADMSEMIQHLAVVANNGPDSIGGGGEPRRPLLPELEPPA